MEYLTPQFATPLLALLMALFFIIQLLMIRSLKSKISSIPQVTLETDFNKQIVDLEQKISVLSGENNKLAQSVSNLIPKSKTIKNTALVRYNPFRDAGVGGLQSFSVATVDENGNGVVISNLYSREMTRVTAKEVREWKHTDQEFSPEELDAINKTK